MKIVTWNCNGKFSARFPEILKEDDDIHVIQGDRPNQYFS